MVRIRPEQAEDEPRVGALVTAAFGDEGESVAALVQDLRASTARRGSWVAEGDGAVIGHVMLSRGWIDADRALVECPVLSPLSVHPKSQGQGVGSALLRYAVEAAERAGSPAVVLEGDPAYYGRLGFEAAGDRGLLAPSSAIPSAAFQWIRLTAHEPWMRGRFVYPDAFWADDSVGLREWRRDRSTGLEVSTVTLGARDLPRLARFYADLLGLACPDIEEGEDWVALRDTGGWSLGIQLEPEQAPAAWPAAAGDQHMQMHLEIRADDLATAEAHATSCGARLAEHQPQDDVRVMLDPEGHPFCLWIED